jgi:uncharacterized protein YkwD
MGIGENIAAGYFSVDDVTEGWLTSDGHCSMIMDGRVNTFGMALVENQNGSYTAYWTQTFGAE